MKIKKAKKENINQLSMLFLDLYKYHSKLDKKNKIKSDVICLKYIKKDLENFFKNPKNDVILIVEENNKIAGFIKFGVTKIPFIIQEKRACIHTIFIDKKYRRHGLAVKLVKEAAKKIKSKNIKEIEVKYILKNKEAVNFWKSFKVKTIFIDTLGIIDIKNIL